MTIQPCAVSSASEDAGDASAVPDDLVYTYYLALPNPEDSVEARAQIKAESLVQSRLAKPLVRLLHANEPDPQVQGILHEALDSPPNLDVLPLTASPLTAMALGFFAYRPLMASTDEKAEKHDPLVLLTLKTTSLAGNQAPHMHPFGSFWLVAAVDVTHHLSEKKGRLSMSQFQMKVHQTEEYMPHHAVRLQNQRLFLASRKRVLADEIFELEEEVGEKRAKLASTEQKLAELPTAPRSSLF